MNHPDNNDYYIYYMYNDNINTSEDFNANDDGLLLLTFKPFTATTTNANTKINFIIFKL